MAERSEEERFRVGEEDVEEAHGGQDQSQAGHGEDRAGHTDAAGDWRDGCQLLSIIRPVGWRWQSSGGPLPLLTGVGVSHHFHLDQE